MKNKFARSRNYLSHMLIYKYNHLKPSNLFSKPTNDTGQLPKELEKKKLTPKLQISFFQPSHMYLY